MLSRFSFRRLLLVMPFLLLVAAPLALADLKTGQDHLAHGRWAEAEKALRAVTGAERPRAVLQLAELYKITGRYAEGIQSVTPLWKDASGAAAIRGAAGALLGELQRETGQMAAARTTLEAAVKLNPKNLRARMALGLVLHETGQKQAADAVFTQFFNDFNNGAIDEKQPEQLTYVAMAARYLESWQDANDTFRDAAKLNKEFFLANLEWAELFLQTYNTAEAQPSLREVLDVNPNHPRALLGMARIKIEDSYDVTAANEFIDKALKQNPRYADALALRAQLFLDNEEYPEAEAEIAKALAVNPVHLRSLSLKAASRYLQDDRAGYDAVKKQVLALNPRFSELFVIVGDQAVRQHRYQEGVALHQQALALDPDDGIALAALGTGLLRLTEEEKGLEQLRKAFERDPFNVRTANVLNLFERIVPRDYEVMTAGSVRIRLNKKERPLLERYVPALMSRAWETFVAKYHFTPKTPVTLEMFTDPQHFSVRTVGLPQMGASGVCFGPLVTAPTPLRGDVNWQQVLWHETAHVFALQLSNNRVSRWFTEGLSEYETMIQRPEWTREHNVELYLALKRGDLPPIEELNAAFTRSRYRQNIVRAYYQSALLITYLVETYGFDKIVEALKLYGKGESDAKVVQSITGKPLAQVNAGFRAYLEKRLAAWGRGFHLDHVAYYDTERWRKEAQAKPGDAAAQAALAVALFTDRKLEPAKAAAEKALGIDARNPTARLLLAEIALAAEEPANARKELETLLQQGVDGYAIRVYLGQIALGEKKTEEAVEHLKKAQAFDPDKEETYTLLAGIYKEQKRPDEALAQMQKLARIDEHDFAHARALVQALAEAGKWDAVPEHAAMANAINPGDATVHELWGRGLAKGGKHAEAVTELETALLLEPKKTAPVHAALAQSYQALGQKEKAKAAAQQAIAEDPNNAEAKVVLSGVGM